MVATPFSCGPESNDSESKAFEFLRNKLNSQPGEWILLTNLMFSVTHQLQADEIDLIVIGPTGVRVVEIKHWTAQWVDAHADVVEREADKLTSKARKIGTTLRKIVPGLPRVDGVILLTQESSKVKRIASKEVRGVKFYTLSDWDKAVNLNPVTVLASHQIKMLSQSLAPKSAVAIDGSMRRLAGYVNLELQSAKSDRFHRVYRGSHPTRQDKVILHLYDLSATDDKSAETKAKREFDALHRLQLHPWAPRILDSWQDAPGYAGEMHFFTVVDPSVPSLQERAGDTTWTSSSRLLFARNTIQAFKDLHEFGGTAEEPMVHRNVTPRTVLVRHDNTPIITGFHRAKIPFEPSVASTTLPKGDEVATVAPEVQKQGLSAADHRSDVYSVCASLSLLFAGRSDETSIRAFEITQLGILEKPDKRKSFAELERQFSELLGDSLPPPEAPPPRFWTEDQVIRFADRDYKIITKLGSGGVGTTFKVEEIDRVTKEGTGTYVAKIVHDGENARSILRSYNLVRSHLRHTGLSTIFQVAKEWQENGFIALMTWIEGSPLSEFLGVFSLLAEDQQELSSESLALRWIQSICEALHVLHRNGLVHGDVSLRNMIVSGSELVLTDYDFVTKCGDKIKSPGTVIYCSPSYGDGCMASPADDIYALAACFFHIVFEREPFRFGGDLEKNRGLNWEGIDQNTCSLLAEFLNKATAADVSERFSSTEEALAFLKNLQSKPTDIEKSSDEAREAPPSRETTSSVELTEQHVEWLLSLLQSYPGSRLQKETRGLDSDFAEQTYVPTELESALLGDIRNRRVRLVVLCGNAGDGKTALFQHLATGLGMGRHLSADRILDGQVQNGPRVRMNLDGSASWNGRSADDILDEFLAPFQDGLPSADIVHLLAINDGRLLEWIEGVEERVGKETYLTNALRSYLEQEEAVQSQHIRFISLNQRSLVGGLDQAGAEIETGFLDRLLDGLYGGDKAAEKWAPCQSCSAKDRCEVFRAARIFGPASISTSEEESIRMRARQRLFEALQSVHLRGETHITVRELRATLVYILFGISYCDEYHSDTDKPMLPYWDRAFSPIAPARQGEVLTELLRFDPGLESHPQVDRYLLSKPALEGAIEVSRYAGLSLESARRRAFFEWTKEDIQQVAGDSNALDLARGRHMRLFRDLPLKGERAVNVNDLCKRLCAGISRLEDLPTEALDRVDVVPLRITPRTPTETAFWVEKPISSFSLEADLPPETEGIERLHRQASLIYRYRNGSIERLRLGAELFHLLLELADGYQLGDVSTDDTFAHLSIFVQRLVREDERELLAWNPMQDESIYKVTGIIADGNSSKQKICLAPIS